MSPFDTSRSGAVARDANDPTPARTDAFHIPVHTDGSPVVYLCGNSLGLQPKATADAVRVELDRWAARGVNGHFEGDAPWFSYHEHCAEAAAHIVGARPDEVVMMNALTVNLHLLMASFYRPSAARHRVAIEAGAFPSDRYAVDSQVAFHGFDPATSVVALPASDGDLFDEAAIEAWLAEHGQDVALVMLGGVNYYTGQVLDLARITRAAHAAGALVGFDLAHAAGNVALSLHEDDVDFAAWCSYKYLNSGPGGVGGAFVHARHGVDAKPPRLAGWWGNDPETRFEMPDRFTPQAGAAGWQLSNAPILPLAAFRASADHFVDVGMAALRARSLRLTDYLLALLDARLGERVDTITPRAPERRGCQVSLRIGADAAQVQAALEARGVVADHRRPDVIRVAPVPLYNTFDDVWRFVDTLAAVLP